MASIVASLIMTKTTEKSEYEDELKPYLQNIGLGLDIVESLYTEALKVISTGEEEEELEDEGELLCDCEFTTWQKFYFTILQLRLKGFKYGFLDRMMVRQHL